jgi:hypothetical protein
MANPRAYVSTSIGRSRRRSTRRCSALGSGRSWAFSTTAWTSPVGSSTSASTTITANAGHREDRRDPLLQQRGEVVDAAPDDDVLLALQHEQLAAVDEAEVTGEQDAVRERLGRAPPPVVVAARDAAPAHRDLPDHALADGDAVVVADVDAQPVERGAEREHRDAGPAGVRHRLGRARHAARAEDADRLADGGPAVATTR